jgi:hypothetical protein
MVNLMNINIICILRICWMSRRGCLSHCPRRREPWAVLHLFNSPNKLMDLAPSWGLGIRFSARSADASSLIYCDKSWCLSKYLPKAVSSDKIWYRTSFNNSSSSHSHQKKESSNVPKGISQGRRKQTWHFSSRTRLQCRQMISERVKFRNHLQTRLTQCSYRYFTI